MTRPEVANGTNRAAVNLSGEPKREIGWVAFWWKTSRAGPVVVMVAALIAVWYVGAWGLNRTVMDIQARVFTEEQGRAPTTWERVAITMSMDRPVLPAPHQIAAEIWKTTVGVRLTSKRNLLYHAGVTLSSTLVGFAFGSFLGILLATGIVHVRSLETSLMPWVITSQTVPILAIAPLIVVVLGSIGLTGVLPKATISAYLSFFPVTIGMVRGLRAPDTAQEDLFSTWAASGWQRYWCLRIPSSLPWLFASLKLSAAISVTGAVVAELPTGSRAGLGARLLAGSYYGQTVQIWSALLMAATLAAFLVISIGALERAVAARRGGAA